MSLWTIECTVVGQLSETMKCALAAVPLSRRLSPPVLLAAITTEHGPYSLYPETSVRSSLSLLQQQDCDKVDLT